MSIAQTALAYWVISEPHKAKELTIPLSMINDYSLQSILKLAVKGIQERENYSWAELYQDCRDADIEGYGHILTNAQTERVNFDIRGDVPSLESKIRKEHNGQEQIKIIAEMLELAKAGDSDAVSAKTSELLGMNRGDEKHDHSFAEMLDKGLEWIQTKASGELHGVSCGYDSLSRCLGAFHNSDLIVIAARSAMGKTAFLVNLALRSNANIGFISAEQPCEQMGIRSMVIDSGANMQSLRAGDLNEYEMALLSDSIERLRSNSGRIYDKPQCTIAQVQQKAREWVHKYGVNALYVDYLQDIKANDQRLPRHEQVGQVADGLKNIARELKIPVITLAQVNRGVESRPDKRPGMGDIKDSGQIEQVADQILTIYRDEYYHEDSQDKGIVEIDVKKNRHGATGCIRMQWHAKSMQFIDPTEVDRGEWDKKSDPLWGQDRATQSHN